MGVFRPISRFSSKTVQDTAIVTVEDHASTADSFALVVSGWVGSIFLDLGWVGSPKMDPRTTLVARGWKPKMWFS